MADSKKHECPVDDCDQHYETERGVGHHLGRSHGLEERFWAKVDKGGPHQCWAWQACRSRYGYGQIGVDGSAEYAHRVSMELHGEDPNGQRVLHYCDNPPCVNPNHLYLGDAADNIQDASDRGGWEPARGEDSGMSKLTESQVREIKKRLRLGRESYGEIAEDYPVALPTIEHIANGRTWSHIEVDDDTVLASE